MPANRFSLLFSVLSIVLAGCVLLSILSIMTPTANAAAAPAQPVAGVAKGVVPQVDEVTYEALVASAADRSTVRLRAQQDWYWSITTAVGTLVLGVMAFLGFGQIRSLRDNVSADVVQKLSVLPQFQDSIASRLDDSILKSIKDSQQAVERQIDFLNIRSLAERVHNVNGFTNLERDSLFQGLLRLKDDTAISAKPEYLIALEQTFSSFFQAGLWDQMDLLESELREVSVTNPNIVTALLSSLAFRILGEAETGPNTLEGFLRYISVSKQLRYAEAGYVYELPYLLMYKPDGWERRIQLLFEDAKDLTDAERQFLVNRIELMSDVTKIARDPQGYHHRLAEQFAKVKAAYAAELAALQVPTQAGTA